VTNSTQRVEMAGPAIKSARFSFHFLTVSYTLTVLVLGANIPTPLYGLYRDEFDFTPFTQTAIFAVYAAGLMPALLFFGPLSDKLGRRFVLLSAVVVALASAAVMVYADGTLWLFAGRTLQGVSIGAVSAAGVAALTEFEPTNTRSKAAVTATLATVLGAALGPVVGGALAQYLHPSLKVPYLVFAILLVPAAFALVFLPDRRQEPGKQLRYFNTPNIPRVVRKVFWLASSRVAVVWGAVGLFQSIIPAWVATTLDIQNLVLVGGIAALVMLLSVLAQLGLRRLRPLAAQRLGLLAVGGGMAALLAVDIYPHPSVLVISASLVGVGHGLVFSGGMRELNMALATSLDRNDGAVIAAFLTINYAGMAVPSLCAGLAVTALGFTTAVAAFTIFGVFFCGLCLAVSVLGADREGVSPVS
jgi:MFS family permease